MNVVPPQRDLFAELLIELESSANHHFALAQLNDLLFACPPIAFQETLQLTTSTTHLLNQLSPLLQNYVAAMVEHAATQKDVAPPAWVRDIPPLDTPHFAGGLRSLRQYLLAVSPVAFKRRNLFVDASICGRV